MSPGSPCCVMILAAMFGITYLGSGEIPLYNPVFLGCELVAVAGAGFSCATPGRHPGPFIPYRLLRGEASA